jgi:hypothetical protein
MIELFAALFAQVPLSPILEEPVTPPPFVLLAPIRSEICYDIDMSPYAGGEDLLFGLRTVEWMVTYLESKLPMIYTKSMAARTWRLCEMFFGYLPLNILAATVQHEVFGHGYRIRDINHGKVEVKGYTIEAPPPYGSGNGETRYSFSRKEITTTDLSLIASAGIEAELILAGLTKFKWLESSKIDPRQTILYLFSWYALRLYGSWSEIEADEIQGHDLSTYIRFLNATYPEGTLTVQALQNRSWINLLDPFTY